MPYPINLTPNELNLIHELAQSYNENLLDKKFTFLFEENNQFIDVVVKFNERNFAHLIGLSKNPNGLNTANKIFNSALNNTMQSNDCYSTHGKQSTLEKISNAQSIFNILEKCNKISVLDTDVVNIASDNIVGGKPACVFSFVEVGDETLVPNSLLNGNISKISGTNAINKILCTVVEDAQGELSLGMVNSDITKDNAEQIINWLQEYDSDSITNHLSNDSKFLQLEAVSNSRILSLSEITGLTNEQIEEYRALDENAIRKPSATIDDSVVMLESPLPSEPNTVYTTDEYPDVCNGMLIYKHDIDDYDKADNKQLFLAQLILDSSDEHLAHYGIDSNSELVSIANEIVNSRDTINNEDTPINPTTTTLSSPSLTIQKPDNLHLDFEITNTYQPIVQDLPKNLSFAFVNKLFRVIDEVMGACEDEYTASYKLTLIDDTQDKRFVYDGKYDFGLFTTRETIISDIERQANRDLKSLDMKDWVFGEKIINDILPDLKEYFSETTLEEDEVIEDFREIYQDLSFFLSPESDEYDYDKERSQIEEKARRVIYEYAHKLQEKQEEPSLSVQSSARELYNNTLEQLSTQEIENPIKIPNLMEGSEYVVDPVSKEDVTPEEYEMRKVGYLRDKSALETSNKIDEQINMSDVSSEVPISEKEIESLYEGIEIPQKRIFNIFYDDSHKKVLPLNEAKAVKAIAIGLSSEIDNRLEQMVRWTEKEETTAQIKVAIRDAVYKLPSEYYHEDTLERYIDNVYNYFYERDKNNELSAEVSTNTTLEEVEPSDTGASATEENKQNIPTIAGNEKVERTTPQLDLPVKLTLGEALGGKSDEYINILNSIERDKLINPSQRKSLFSDTLVKDPVLDEEIDEDIWKDRQKEYIADKNVIDTYNNIKRSSYGSAEFEKQRYLRDVSATREEEEKKTIENVEPSDKDTLASTSENTDNASAENIEHNDVERVVEMDLPAKDLGKGDIFAGEVNWYEKAEVVKLKNIRVGDVITDQNLEGSTAKTRSVVLSKSNNELSLGNVDKCGISMQEATYVYEPHDWINENESKNFGERELYRVGHTENLEIATYGYQEMLREQLEESLNSTNSIEEDEQELTTNNQVHKQTNNLVDKQEEIEDNTPDEASIDATENTDKGVDRDDTTRQSTVRGTGGSEVHLHSGELSSDNREISDDGGTRRVLQQRETESQIRREERSVDSVAVESTQSSNRRRDKSTTTAVRPILAEDEYGRLDGGESGETRSDRESLLEDNENNSNENDSNDLIDTDLDAQATTSTYERAEKNVAALRVRKEIKEKTVESGLEFGDIKATTEQQRTLAQYSGWGGAALAFDERESGKWADIRSELRDLLTEDEYKSARASVLTAYYTPAQVVDVMFDTIKSAGVGKTKDAYMLEPGCGTGNFLRSVPSDMKTNLLGIEIDPVSADIATLISPKSCVVVNSDISNCIISEDSFDCVIGNVPYDKETKIQGQVIHDYFVDKSVDALRSGGVAALLTSRYTLDKKNTNARVELAQKAELIGAVRLPEETFERQAGTSVISDILFLKKRDTPLSKEDAQKEPWIDTFEVKDTGVLVNSWFAGEDGANHTVGTRTIANGRFGSTLRVRSDTPIEELGQEIRRALEAQPISQLTQKGNFEENLGKRKSLPSVVEKPHFDENTFSYELGEDDKSIFYTSNPPVAFEPKNEKELAKAIEMLHVRNSVRELLEMELLPSTTDEQVQAKIAEVSEKYKHFTGEYGLLNAPENKRIFVNTHRPYDNSINQYLFCLEVGKTEKNRYQFKRESDMLHKRTVRPILEKPVHLDSPQDALAQCLDVKGEVDLDYIAGVLSLKDSEGNFDRNDLIHRLGGQVIIDPLSDSAVLSAEYLSGNIAEKLDEVNAEIEKVQDGGLSDVQDTWERSLEIDSKNLEISLREEVFDGIDELKDKGIWYAGINGFAQNRTADIRRNLVNLLTNKRVSSFVRTHELEIATIAIRQSEQKTLHFEKENLEKDPFFGVLFHHIDLHRRYLDNKTFYSFIHELIKKNISVQSLANVLYINNFGCDNPTCLTNYYFNGTRVADLLRLIDPSTHDFSTLTSSDIAKMILDNPAAVEYCLSASAKDDITQEGYKEFLDKREKYFSERAESVDRTRLSTLNYAKSQLEEVLPKRLGRDEIRATFGSPWIPANVVYDFISEKFLNTKGASSFWATNSAKKALRECTLEKSDLTGKWSFNAKGIAISSEAEAEYGVDGYPFSSLIESALNNTTISVTKNVGGKKVSDPERTLRAIKQVEKIRNEFMSWVWTDKDREKLLCDIYNKQFNSLVPRAYDGNYLSFGDMGGDVELYKHQKDAIARVLQSDEGTLIAHVVGAGKTYTSCVSAHEAKRLGRCSKPLIVVPNHLTEQWAQEFTKLYPTAKVIYTNKNTQGKESMQTFWGQVRAGDWDAVIVGSSKFDALKMSNVRQSAYYEKRIDELKKMLAEANDIHGKKSFNVKQIEQAKKRFEREVEKIDSKAKIGGVCFDDLGCDMLIVDEAHNYKNLAQSGGSLPGMATSSSIKCEDLLAKCDYLRERGYGKNIVFCTGTPVSNTMVELFNMQRYLAPKLLKKQNISAFPAWANTFGEAIQSFEAKPEGSGFQTKLRFARFFNLPELMKNYHTFADIKTNNEIKLDIPDVEIHPIKVPASEVQRDYIKQFSERAERVRTGRIDPSIDNMLKITSDGRKLALDPRLLDSTIEEVDYGKIDACAEQIYEIWTKNSDSKATQLVFCDSSTDTSGNKFNAYSTLRTKLEQLGIPSSEIASINDAGNSAEKKEALFDDVRRGDVRVLIGSTAKLGTGTNVQDRLIATHDLDCPWRPADLEQRLGRVQRQGNMFDKVDCYRYVTEGTFDAYMYQTVERKQRFISQVFTNENPSREADDVDETVLNYSEIKKLATGDPVSVKIMELQNEKMGLELEIKAERQQRSRMRQKLNDEIKPAYNVTKSRVEALERDKDAFAGAVDTWNKIKYNQQAQTQSQQQITGLQDIDSTKTENKTCNDIENCFVGGVAYKTESEFNKAIISFVKTKVKRDSTCQVGMWCGLPIYAISRPVYDPISTWDDVKLSLANPRLDSSKFELSAKAHEPKFSMAHGTSGTSTPIAQLARLAENEADESAFEKVKSEYLGLQTQMNDIQRVLDRPIQAEVRLSELNAKLKELSAGIGTEEFVAGAINSAFDEIHDDTREEAGADARSNDGKTLIVIDGVEHEVVEEHDATKTFSEEKGGMLCAEQEQKTLGDDGVDVVHDYEQNAER